MSQIIKVSSLIFEDLDYSVPATIEEYNALAPKRTNPILEDAIDNIMKHKVLSQFRNKFLDWVEEKYKDIPESARKNFGTEKTPKWEADMPYITRLQALVLTSEGKSPTDAAAAKAFSDQLRQDAQRVLSEQKFNVAEREPTLGGGGAIAKTYLEMAKQSFAKGREFADKLLGYLNKATNSALAYGDDEEANIATLAKAISANEKRKREVELAAAKSEYGLAEV